MGPEASRGTAGWLPLKGLGFLDPYYADLTLFTHGETKGERWGMGKRQGAGKNEENSRFGKGTKLSTQRIPPSDRLRTWPDCLCDRRQAAATHPHAHPLPLLHSDRACSGEPSMSTRTTPGN